MIKIETDYASIKVLEKGNCTEEFVIRHVLHQLMKKYTRMFGLENTESVIKELHSYHCENND